jgi:anaerobic magnesium-protoporphyrin IX monomethyl ester cyclase
MRILFANAFFMAFDRKQKKAAMPYPPLATIYAAAVAKKDSHIVDLFDTTFSLPSYIEAKIKSFQPDLVVIYDDNFNYITKMCLRNMRHAAFEMARIAKMHDCKVITNSSDASDHADLYLNNHNDFVVIGEGEITLHELLSNLNQNEKTVKSIKGIAFKENNTIVKTEKRLSLKDPDVLPMPLFELIQWEQYKSIWQSQHGYFSINLVTTRGCPYKCNWCAKPIFGQRYNVHSVENTIAEIRYLKQLVPFDHIWFCDDIFGLKPDWIANFNAALKREDIKINYKIQSRADLLLDEKYVKDLSESGCNEVWIGVESGSQKILDAMDKGTRIEQIEMATALLKQNNIKPCFFIQYGYLQEDKTDILKTLAIIEQLQPHDIGVSVSYPLPETKFYEKVKSTLTEKKNWDDTNDFEMMYKATYPTDFYRHLQLYTHKKFRIRKKEKRFSEKIKSVYHYFGMLYHKNKVNQYDNFIR